MLSFKVVVCASVLLPVLGCNRTETHAQPDSVTASAGSSAVSAAGSMATGGSGGSGGTAGPVGASTTITTNSAANSGNDSDTETLTDPQIAAVTDAANDGEIAQAKVAQGKARDSRVKAFAAMMIAHHGKAKEKQTKLGITSADSALSKKLKADGAATLASLNAAPAGAEFDHTYIQSQVDGHQKVLDAINDRLLPSVKSAPLAAYVKEIKPTVEAHLKEARDILHSLAAAKPASAMGTGGSGSSNRQMGTASSGSARQMGTGGSGSATRQ